MNRDHHTSYRCSIVNKKGGNNNKKERPGLDYMRLPLYLSYMELSMEEQKNEYYYSQFQHLQGHIGHVMTRCPRPVTALMHLPTHPLISHMCITFFLQLFLLSYSGSKNHPNVWPF